MVNPRDININLENIRQGKTNSTLKIRQILANNTENFAQNRQMDAQSFYDYLIRKLDLDTFGIFIKTRCYDLVRCDNCNIQWENPENYQLINTHFLYFPEDCGNIIDFNSMFLLQATDRTCQHCNFNLKSRTKAIVNQKYMVICFQRANVRGERINTKFSNFNPECVLIDNQRFKVKSVVRHHGNTINSGHYTSLVNYNNQWWECNDETITRLTNFDNTLKDVYLLILELISH